MITVESLTAYVKVTCGQVNSAAHLPCTRLYKNQTYWSGFLALLVFNHSDTRTQDVLSNIPLVAISALQKQTFSCYLNLSIKNSLHLNSRLIFHLEWEQRPRVFNSTSFIIFCV